MSTWLWTEGNPSASSQVRDPSGIPIPHPIERGSWSPPGAPRGERKISEDCNDGSSFLRSGSYISASNSRGGLRTVSRPCSLCHWLGSLDPTDCTVTNNPRPTAWLGLHLYCAHPTLDLCLTGHKTTHYTFHAHASRLTPHFGTDDPITVGQCQLSKVIHRSPRRFGPVRIEAHDWPPASEGEPRPTPHLRSH